MKRTWALALARLYVRRRLSRSLDGVHVGGLEPARAALVRGPLILAANHVCYWDAFAVVLLDALLAADGYCVMDAAELRRLPFFGALGAVPLDRSSARASLRDLDAAASLLDRPGRALWIFPQGKQLPGHLRPLGLQRGVERLAQKSGAALVPIALGYPFGERPQPRLAVSFGAPLDEVRISALEGALARELERIDRWSIEGGGRFVEVLQARGRGRVPLAGRWLARWLGGSDA